MANFGKIGKFISTSTGKMLRKVAPKIKQVAEELPKRIKSLHPDENIKATAKYISRGNVIDKVKAEAYLIKKHGAEKAKELMSNLSDWEKGRMMKGNRKFYDDLVKKAKDLLD